MGVGPGNAIEAALPAVRTGRSRLCEAKRG
ncbi:MAG: hypothetical protein JWQ94_213 [Tardiphaga sp.]|nr:hypothetical protein [Tardiphaga sp.]